MRKTPNYHRGVVRNSHFEMVVDFTIVFIIMQRKSTCFNLNTKLERSDPGTSSSFAMKDGAFGEVTLPPPKFSFLN